MAEQFVQILATLQSGDNDARKQAETAYGLVLDNPAQAAGFFFQVMAGGTPDQRDQAATLLRTALFRKVKTLDNKPLTFYQGLGDAGVAQVKTSILQQFQADQTPAVRKRFAILIAEIAQLCEGDDISAAWPELLPMLFNLLTTQPAARIACLTVLEECAEMVAEKLLKEAVFGSVLGACAADPDPEARSVLFVMVLKFICATKPKVWGPVKPLLPAMLTLVDEVAVAKEKLALNVLQGMNEVAENAPKFLEDNLGTHILPACIKFADTDGLPQDIRKFSLEILVTMGEHKKGKVCLKVPQYAESVVQSCMKFAINLDDDVKAWAAQEAEADSDNEGEELHNYGKESLDLFCRNLSGEKILPIVFPHLHTLLSSADWKHVVAGLGIMSRLAEYVEEESQVDELVKQAITRLQNENPRIKYSAWSCVAQYAEDHKPYVADTYAREICENFAIALGDQTQKVLQRTLQGFGMVASNMDRDTLDPFCQPLLLKLGPALKATQNFPVLLTEVIACISVMAEKMEDGFAAYYNDLMPLLLETMQFTSTKAEARECFGRTIEGIAYLGKGAGAAVFAQHAKHVMEVLVSACKGMDANDIAMEYIIMAADCICETLKKDFADFIPGVLPLTLMKCANKPQTVEEGSDMLKAQEEGKMEITMTVVQGADGATKIFGMKTAEIEDMQNALVLIKTMIDSTEERYLPHVQQTAAGILPVFEFELGEEVRDCAFDVWGSLIKVARHGDPAVLNELFHSLLPRLLEQMEKTDDLGWELTQAGGLVTMIRNAGPNILQDAHMTGIAEKVVTLLDESFARRAEGGEEEDEEDSDGPDDDADSDDFNFKTVDIKIRTALCEILGAMMESHPDQFVKLVLPGLLQNNVSKYMTQSDKDHIVEDQRLALYIIDDMLEHLGDRAVHTWETILPFLIGHIGHADIATSQAVNYGCTLVAKNPQFAPMAAVAAQKLRAALPSMAKSKKKGKQNVKGLAARDNAVSALTLLLVHHPTAIPDAAAAWVESLNYMPIKMDEEEGIKVHALLCELVQKQHAVLIGPNFANVPKILGILAEVYMTESVAENTNVAIRQIVATLGEAGLAQFGAQMTTKQQKKIERIWKDSQKK